MSNGSNEGQRAWGEFAGLLNIVDNCGRSSATPIIGCGRKSGGSSYLSLFAVNVPAAFTGCTSIVPVMPASPSQAPV